MLTELVFTQASDGLRLDGALNLPQQAAEDLPVDVLVLLPGVASNFYSATLLEQLAPRLLDAGTAVLRANTRGRDGFYTARVTGGAVRAGAAFETVDDCRRDLAAWAAFLKERGFGRLGLFGHSLSAIKSVHASAAMRRPEWDCVIAASPPRLCYSLFLTGPRADEFRESMEHAQRLVAEGRGGELFQARFPFPLLICGSAYVDKYGPQERYDILKCVARLPCPTLFTYGEVELREGGVAFAGLDDAVCKASIEPDCCQPDVDVISGADHFYTGKADALCEAALNWLRSMPSA